MRDRMKHMRDRNNKLCACKITLTSRSHIYIYIDRATIVQLSFWDDPTRAENDP